MRRRLWLTAAVLTLCLTAAGCAATAPEETGPELILRYADNQPEDYPTTKAAEYFAQLVEERTHGRIRIRLYCDGELGDEVTVLEQVQFGGIDMSRVSAGTYSEYNTEIDVLMLPYLYDDAEHMWRVLDGEIGDMFLTSTRKTGVIGLSWFDAGARSFYTRDKITGLADLKGKKIRVQESELMSRMVQCLGAEPMEIQYGDVYSALQTRKIDGAENNMPSYLSMGHYEAAPYFLLDAHSRLPEMQIISTVAWDKIAAVDEDYPTIVAQCARECAQYERQLWNQREQEAQQRMQELGVEVTTIDEEELNRFREAVEPLYESFSEEKQALIQRIRES